MWLALMPTDAEGFLDAVIHPGGVPLKALPGFPVHRPNQFRPVYPAPVGDDIRFR